MVATRHSLGARASPPAADTNTTTAMTKKASKEMQRLAIQGTDVLKGDAKQFAPAETTGEVYHYRGAVYAVTKDTRKEWLDAQPKRYAQKRQMDDEDEDDAELVEKRRKVVADKPTKGRRSPGDGVSEEAAVAKPATGGTKRRRALSSAEHDGVLGNEKPGLPVKRQRRAAAAGDEGPGLSVKRPRKSAGGAAAGKATPRARRPAPAKESNNSRAFDMCVIGGTNELRPAPDLDAYIPDLTKNGCERKTAERKTDGGSKTREASNTTADGRVAQTTTTMTRKKKKKMGEAQYIPTADEDEKNKTELTKLAEVMRMIKEKELELQKAKALNAFLMAEQTTEQQEDTESTQLIVCAESGFGDGSKTEQDIRRERIEEQELYADAEEGENVDEGGFFEGGNITAEQDATAGAERSASEQVIEEAERSHLKMAENAILDHGIEREASCGKRGIDAAPAEDATTTSPHQDATSPEQYNDVDTVIQHKLQNDRAALKASQKPVDYADMPTADSPTIAESPPGREEAPATAFIGQAAARNNSLSAQPADMQPTSSKATNTQASAGANPPLPAADSSRPSTSHSGTSARTALSRASRATGWNANPVPNPRLSSPARAAGYSSTPSSDSKSSHVTTSSFTALRPTDTLPATDKGGNELRWSIRVGQDGQGRQEYTVDRKRLVGENVGAKRRRLRRELEVVNAWALVSGGSVKEIRADSERESLETRRSS